MDYTPEYLRENADREEQISLERYGEVLEGDRPLIDQLRAHASALERLAELENKLANASHNAKHLIEKVAERDAEIAELRRRLGDEK